MSNQFARYDSYKDSGVEWIGQVPAHWEIKKVKYVIKEHSGNGFPIQLQGNSNNLEIPFYKVSDINGKGDFLKVSNNYVSHSVIKQNGWNYVPKHSIITAKIGEALRKNHRKIVLSECIIDNNCIGLEAQKINFKYNYYVHKVIDFDWFTNSGTVPSISVEKYKNFTIIIPYFDEQQRIADFLDKKTAQIDEAIAQKEKMIELLKEYRQVVINNAVTKGLDPNVPMKDSGVGWLGQIPAHWNISKLKFVTRQIVDGTHFTPTYRDSGVPFLRVTDLHHQTLELNDVKFISHKEHNDLIKRCNPTKGDLLLSKNGTIGLTKVVDWDFEFSIFVSLCLIKINYSLLNAHLLSYQINSNIFIQQLIESGKTTSVTNLHLDMIKDLIVVLPSIIEQQEIADFLDKKNEQIDEAISLKQSEIEKLKEYKATLIDSAVTGKIKV